VKEDMSVPVVRTTMPDDLYSAFKTEEHLDNLRQWNPIFAQHLFEQHKCYRQDQGRTLQIKTSMEVVKYIMEKDFVVQYPSGEVYFQKEINWTAARAVCTLPVDPKPSGASAGATGGTTGKPAPIKPPVHKAKENVARLAPEDGSKQGKDSPATKPKPEDRSGVKGRSRVVKEGPTGAAASASGKPEARLADPPKQGSSRSTDGSVKVLQRHTKDVQQQVGSPSTTGGDVVKSDAREGRYSTTQELNQVLKEWDALPLLEDQQKVQAAKVLDPSKGERSPASVLGQGVPLDHDYGRRGGLQVLAEAAEKVSEETLREEGELPEEGEEALLQMDSQKPDGTVFESAMGSDLDYEVDSEDYERHQLAASAQPAEGDGMDQQQAE